MKKILLITAILVIASFILTSCDGAASGNMTAGNKTTANTNAANTSSANMTVSSATSEADVRKLFADVTSALNKNDTAALEKIYADDYVLINTDGSMQTRAERLATIKSGELKFDSLSYSDVAVRVYGDTAVVTAIATVKATNKGKPLDQKQRVTQVDVKTKDGWRMVSAQTNEIKEAAKADGSNKSANANTK